MEHELTQLEDRLEDHIKKHDEDYKKLVWWIVGVLGTLLAVSGGFWTQYGKLESEVAHNTDEIENIRSSFVTAKDLSAATALFDSKLDTIRQGQLETQKGLDDIKRALNIR